MGDVLQLLGALISLLIRVAILLVGTPFMLLWPRQDKSLSYSQTVWSCYKRIFAWVLV